MSKFLHLLKEKKFEVSIMIVKFFFCSDSKTLLKSKKMDIFCLWSLRVFFQKKYYFFTESLIWSLPVTVFLFFLPNTNLFLLLSLNSQYLLFSQFFPNVFEFWMFFNSFFPNVAILILFEDPVHDDPLWDFWNKCQKNKINKM